MVHTREDHATRGMIFERHKQYTLGLYQFLTTDPVVPSALRAEALGWGLCADEFEDTAGWPHQARIAILFATTITDPSADVWDHAVPTTGKDHNLVCLPYALPRRRVGPV